VFGETQCFRVENQLMLQCRIRVIILHTFVGEALRDETEQQGRGSARPRMAIWDVESGHLLTTLSGHGDSAQVMKGRKS
jgi:hypothetical protein